ncbi:endopeptidase La [Mucisphaera calidilacus]|uniref:Lon protease n=1 Tax=Mucisphaera calidilacus TaxID=2527982 RepID=A0A518BXM0_9BACT|nr:endopeptidase La [Mucisphaera calidilacus]QDU71720.1 Lon protease 2 [Mucisphaera calidilacus]
MAKKKSTPKSTPKTGRKTAGSQAKKSAKKPAKKLPRRVARVVGKKKPPTRRKRAAAETAQTPSPGNDALANTGTPPIPSELPILPLRGTVVFPGTITPISIGRASSRQLLDESLATSKFIGLFTQREETEEEPGIDDLYEMGTAAMVLKLVRQPDENLSIIVHGLKRVRALKATKTNPYLRAQVEEPSERPGSSKTFDAAIAQLREQARQLIELSPNAPEQALTVLLNIDDPGNLADFLAANIDLSVEQKQDILELTDVAKRVRAIHHHVSSRLQLAQLQAKIQEDVEIAIGDNQRKFFLREQIKAMQKELGEDTGDGEQLITRLREQLEQAAPPEAVMEEAQRELTRLEAIPPASPEHSVISSYIELIAELPWNTASEENLDLIEARAILDRDHFDLDKVKRRLIEYLAVRKLNPDSRGPILCLVGPPGVGKTSLGQSIADAMGRKFARLSLGGVRDEAEIRGHRRTYVGAMPGRIIQAIRRAGTNNPVLMLDEIDKLGADFRGDPASALLELLDPRQNNAFVDRYLDVPFDLSAVLFIATANYMGHVPPALHDRLEVIEIPGYTDHDKAAIARKYLIPRQLKEHGLRRSQCRWAAPAIHTVIEHYTREAGVRELDRQIAAVCRNVASEVASRPRRKGSRARTANGKPDSRSVTPDLVREALGPEKYVREIDDRTKPPGVATGLAYTPVGGEVLYVEAAAFPGKGGFKLTGQIGDVMKESAAAALSLFRGRAEALGYDPDKLAETDIHIHVPAGAIPKDGPSAGTSMFTAIASLLLDKPVRGRLAMTGEITLRGKVLPVGGIKEKTLAAERAGVRTVLLPKLNERDLEEIDPRVRKRLKFRFVDTIDQILDHALGVKTR